MGVVRTIQTRRDSREGRTFAGQARREQRINSFSHRGLGKSVTLAFSSRLNSARTLSSDLIPSWVQTFDSQRFRQTSRQTPWLPIARRRSRARAHARRCCCCCSRWRQAAPRRSAPPARPPSATAISPTPWAARWTAAATTMLRAPGVCGAARPSASRRRARARMRRGPTRCDAERQCSSGARAWPPASGSGGWRGRHRGTSGQCRRLLLVVLLVLVQLPPKALPCKQAGSAAGL